MRKSVENKVWSILEQIDQAYTGDFRNIKKLTNSSFTSMLNLCSQLDGVLVSFNNRDVAQKLHDRLEKMEDEFEDLIRDIRHEASKEVYDEVYLKKTDNIPPDQLGNQQMPPEGKPKENPKDGKEEQEEKK